MQHFLDESGNIPKQMPNETIHFACSVHWLFPQRIQIKLSTIRKMLINTKHNNRESKTANFGTQ